MRAEDGGLGWPRNSYHILFSWIIQVVFAFALVERGILALTDS